MCTTPVHIMVSGHRRAYTCGYARVGGAQGVVEELYRGGCCCAWPYNPVKVGWGRNCRHILTGYLVSWLCCTQKKEH